MAQRADCVPVMGARKRSQLRDALAAVEIRLSADDLAQIATAIPVEDVAGPRYHAAQLKMLDSEA